MVVNTVHWRRNHDPADGYNTLLTVARTPGCAPMSGPEAGGEQRPRGPSQTRSSGGGVDPGRRTAGRNMWDGGGRSFWAEVFGRRVRGSIQLVQ